jgi:molecular chaperone GrpE
VTEDEGTKSAGLSEVAGDDAADDVVVEGEAEDEAGESMPDEIEQLSAQAAEYLDGWQRARAELANYKKRVERERREAYSRAAGDILAQFLDVVDDFERALKDLPIEDETASWVQGIELVHRKMKAIMDSYGIEPIDAAGQPFDPTLHEAISHEETDLVPEGYVIDVVKQGYRMGDRILRAATVRVAKSGGGR